MISLRKKLGLFSIEISQSTFLIIVIVSESLANHYIDTAINVTSSDPQKLKIIYFKIEQNGAMNVTFELLKPWDHILV